MMDGVLNADPFSPNLLFAKAIQEISRGNADGARNILTKLERLAPATDERIVNLRKSLQ